MKRVWLLSIACLFLVAGPAAAPAAVNDNSSNEDVAAAEERARLAELQAEQARAEAERAAAAEQEAQARKLEAQAHLKEVKKKAEAEMKQAKAAAREASREEGQAKKAAEQVKDQAEGDGVDAIGMAGQDATPEKVLSEEQKHAQRQARLLEMLKVARDIKDPTAIERVELLQKREQQLYQDKIGKAMGEAGLVKPPVSPDAPAQPPVTPENLYDEINKMDEAIDADLQVEKK